MLPNRRVVVAQLRAQEDAMDLVLAPPDKVERNLHVAIGDPQAPLATVLTVLEINGLLGDDGRLRPEVGLVSVGDHFDWGKPEERQRATDEGTQLLAWLAAHPPNQVQLVFGNHDLVRVGELSQFTDESFREAQSQADKVGTSAKAREAFLKAWPMVPGPEVVTRDFSCFDVKQRELVTRLLKKRRARLAVAIAPDLLVVHAGITTADLEVIDAVGRDALGIAVALNRYLDDRVAEWNGKTPLDLSPLHEQGSAKNGEAKGILFHRPANPASARV
ncbi:MAG TPA: transcriptional regulator, partial [Archangium sp.]